MMKKKMLIASVIVVLILALPLPALAELPQNTEQKKWTFMFYADSDFTPNYGGLSDIISSYMSSSDNTNILVLQDPNPDPATIWYIDENHNATLLENLGEINMGNYTSLRNFINYAKNNFPAEGYMLVLWDHGMAWDGACIEITNVSGEDHLTMVEMQRALKESGGVNIIGFSACLMGCIESAYELRNYTEVYFGSEEMNGFNSWPWGGISQILDKNCNESTYNISKKIMDAFKDINPYFGGKGYWKNEIYLAKYYHRLLPWLDLPCVTMAAVRSDRLNELARAIDNFSTVLIKNTGFCKRYITCARLRVEDFPVPMSLVPTIIMGTQVDIYHLADLLSKPSFRISKPELYAAAQNVKTCINEAIIGEYHQIGHRNAHGLSIYFPPKNSKYQPYDNTYSNCGLDFVENTHWDEFLEMYLN